MSKSIFDQQFEDMLELDKSLDINAMLESIPAIDKEEEPVKEPEDEPKEDETELEDINTVLEKVKTEPVDKSTKQTKKVVEVDDKDDKAPATNEQSTTEDASDAPFTVIFAKDLVQQGLISSFDEEKYTKDVAEVGEATALRNLIKEEIESNIEAAKSDLEEGYKEFLNLIGKGVDTNSAANLVDLKNRFEAIKVEDLEKEDNTELRKQILTDYFKLTTSMSDAKINKLVQNSIDLGDDVDDSKEYLSILKNSIKEQINEEIAEAERQLALKADENKRIMDSIKDTVNAVDEIIPGVGINKQTKIKMYEDLTKEVKDSKGRITNSLWAKRAEDPIFFDTRLAYLLETGFFEKNKPWNKASQVKVTKTISELEKAIESKRNTGSNIGRPILLDSEVEKTVKDNIDAMRGLFK